MKRRETGILGEKMAADFLARNGYRILENNYRCPGGEVDIIALHGETLVFVEVRTKRSLSFGSPEESITPVKQARLRAVADPQLTHNTHYIDVRGKTGNISIKLENVPSPDNPKTAWLACYSALAALKQVQAGVRYGT